VRLLPSYFALLHALLRIDTRCFCGCHFEPTERKLNFLCCWIKTAELHLLAEDVINDANFPWWNIKERRKLSSQSHSLVQFSPQDTRDEMMIEREAKRVIESSVVGFAFAGRHIFGQRHILSKLDANDAWQFIFYFIIISWIWAWQVALTVLVILAGDNTRHMMQNIQLYSVKPMRKVFVWVCNFGRLLLHDDSTAGSTMMRYIQDQVRRCNSTLYQQNTTRNGG